MPNGNNTRWRGGDVSDSDSDQDFVPRTRAQARGRRSRAAATTASTPALAPSTPKSPGESYPVNAQDTGSGAGSGITTRRRGKKRAHSPNTNNNANGMSGNNGPRPRGRAQRDRSRSRALSTIPMASMPPLTVPAPDDVAVRALGLAQSARPGAGVLSLEHEQLVRMREGHIYRPRPGRKVDADRNWRVLTLSEAAWTRLEEVGCVGKGRAWTAREGYDDHGEPVKPELPYVMLTKLVIASSPRKMLTLNQIYQGMEERWPYFRSQGQTFRNSIRHNLSMNPAFINVERPLDEGGLGAIGKGGYWRVSEDSTTSHRGRAKKQRVKGPDDPPKPRGRPKNSSKRQRSPTPPSPGIPIDPALMQYHPRHVVPLRPATVFTPRRFGGHGLNDMEMDQDAPAVGQPGSPSRSTPAPNGYHHFLDGHEQPPGLYPSYGHGPQPGTYPLPPRDMYRSHPSQPESLERGQPSSSETQLPTPPIRHAGQAPAATQ
ncbi:uncharacterized protein EHS24_008334 [Apiotrichum porosum]|uniref:Fork-head domain-containing protein n=1 Tax=Apiotrichum porosum TaxID=105984 RepID=A0A427XPY4_9TREE|nr:uncharacterized protein EHS24_008334 [Apiotrichum porosum]RSH80906.1 hypothetical protein EHS24_008334 [Apiotrichum porosum]